MSIPRHTAYNFVGAVIPLSVALVTVPIYLNVIGFDRYGVLSICWLLVGYFTLFDFGLGRATAQKIATLSDAPITERSRIFWTSATLSLALSVAAVLVSIPLATIGLKMVNLANSGLRQEVQASVPLLVTAIPFGIAQSLLAGTLEGRREFLQINLINVVGSIATALLPLLAALWIEPRLPVLLAAALISRALVLLLLSLACLKAVPLLRPSIGSSNEVRRLLQFGGWTAITNIVGPLLVVLDRFAIGAVLSATAVALYVIPYNLVGQLVLLPAALASALFPRLAASPVNDARAMSDGSISILAFLLTPATLIMLAVVHPFLTLWIGEDTGRVSSPVAYVLLLGLWANSLARIPFTRLQAGGHPDVIAKTHLIEIVPYFALLYLGIVHFGLVGAAVAWSVRCTADAVILMLIDRVNRSTLRLLSLHGALVLATIVVMLQTPPTAPHRWLLLGLIGALMAVLLVHTMPSQLVGFIRKYSARRNSETGSSR